MTCKNCNNTLVGTEDFCPYCGTSQKENEIKAIPIPEKADTPQSSEGSIFHSEPVYIYTDPPKEKKDAKTKIATVLVSVFLLSILVIGGLSLMQYFNLTPAFSALISTLPNRKEDTTYADTIESEFDSSVGTVTPDINFKNTFCTVTSEKGLPLRKGPDNSYAQTELLSKDSLLQVTGKSLQNDMWVYVYVPSLDIYGWVSASYITHSASLKEPDITELTEADTEPKTE
jgi:hypothetical protein